MRRLIKLIKFLKELEKRVKGLEAREKINDIAFEGIIDKIYKQEQHESKERVKNSSILKYNKSIINDFFYN